MKKSKVKTQTEDEQEAEWVKGVLRAGLSAMGNVNRESAQSEISRALLCAYGAIRALVNERKQPHEVKAMDVLCSLVFVVAGGEIELVEYMGGPITLAGSTIAAFGDARALLEAGANYSMALDSLLNEDGGWSIAGEERRALSDVDAEVAERQGRRK